MINRGTLAASAADWDGKMGKSEKEIEALLEANKDKIKDYEKKWQEIALSSTPGGKNRMAEAGKKIYKAINEVFPECIITLPSPMAGVLCAALLDVYTEPLVDDQTLAALPRAIATYMEEEYGFRTTKDKENSQDSADPGLVQSLVARLKELPKEKTSAQLYTCAYGNHDAAWVGMHEFLWREIGIEECAQVEPFIELAHNCNWWWPFKECVIFSEKHTFISLDENKELHAEGRKAIEYSDGFGFYFWHGMQLPEEYGSKCVKDWDPKWLLTEEHAELKKLFIEQIGYERICHEVGGRKISQYYSKTSGHYELLRIENADVEPIHLLKMVCPSTGHLHMNRTPPEIEDARKAATWMNGGIDPEDFAQQS